MKLYEVINGYIGESYVRVYVIAESKEAALAEDYYDDLVIVELADCSQPIVTQPSDEGWKVT